MATTGSTTDCSLASFGVRRFCGTTIVPQRTAVAGIPGTDPAPKALLHGNGSKRGSAAAVVCAPAMLVLHANRTKHAKTDASNVTRVVEAVTHPDHIVSSPNSFARRAAETRGSRSARMHAVMLNLKRVSRALYWA